MRRKLLGVFAVLTGAVGCASTVVKKNPGEHDRGIRYYRPKPYLRLAPAENVTEPGSVTLKLEYLPDYAEEYSIHVRAGLGKNKTAIKLDNGWNLASIDVDVDSQTDEVVNSVAALLGAVPKVLNPGKVGAAPPQTADTSMTVSAHEVPLGYYESVLGTGPDGKRRLYGWRYVGFAPFAGCPLEASGLQCQPCDQADLFGLVTINNKLHFRRVSELAAQPAVIKAAASQPPAVNTAPPPAEVPFNPVPASPIRK